MSPVIAIVGRPNVGKSALFNAMLKRNEAVVADWSGVTRDRHFATGEFKGAPFTVIDTGGVGEAENDMDALMESQSFKAIDDASHILFVVDSKAGRTAGDERLAQHLRQAKKPVTLVVNKSEGLDLGTAAADFFALGLSDVMSVSALHRQGILGLLGHVLEDAPKYPKPLMPYPPKPRFLSPIKVALVGRPNVGKSTLLNRLVGESRVVVYDAPGTTMDSISVPYERNGQQYEIIDTAGVRRRAKVTESTEQASVYKTLSAIQSAHVAMVLIDAKTGIAEQDLSLIDFALDAGKCLIIAINKWDNLDKETREDIKSRVKERLRFVPWVQILTISALHGTGVGLLFDAVHRAWDSAHVEIKGTQLNNLLQEIVAEHAPPIVQGRRIKLRYAHIGGHAPPTIVIHGNQTEALPDGYKRFIMNRVRKTFDIVGTPIQIKCVTSDNPYKDKKNALSERQARRRQRMIRHHKVIKRKRQQSKRRK